jgi:hypothetical protein
LGAFHLSPGITPELADLFVVELPILVGLAYGLWGRRGVEVAFGLNGVALGVVKFVTDPTDLPDVVVALAGVIGGAAILASRFGSPSSWFPPPLLWQALGGVVLVIGVIKILRDFYDPFDLLLGDACVVSGGWLLIGTVTRPGSYGRPGPKVRPSVET